MRNQVDRSSYDYNRGLLDGAQSIKDVIDRGHTVDTIKQCIENIIYNASQDR